MRFCRSPLVGVRVGLGGARVPRAVSVLGLVAAVAVFADTPRAQPAAPAAPAPGRLVGRTSDDTLRLAKERAQRPGTSETERLAALAVIARVSGSADFRATEAAFAAIAADASVPAEVRDEAGLLARQAAVDDGATPGIEKARALGVITDLAVLGPFRDAGGGLEAKDGPEAKGAIFTDLRASHSWGANDVHWRGVPAELASASGVPLDLLIEPRKESCTWLATSFALAKDAPLLVKVAASGQVRMTFDGVDVAKSDEVHASLRFDRLAATVQASAGAHLLAAKVCSGALADEGRARLRLLGADGAPLPKSAFTSPPSARLTAPVSTAPRVKRSTTLLERALATGAKATPASLLAAATVRTIGGADDTRSPRAPGLLDAYTQDASRSPDEQAMAAWLTPAAAPRSGRLYKARELAKARGDAETAAFVDRRLVEAHLDAAMPDWAIATLRASHLDTAKDDEALTMRARTMETLRLEPESVRAMRELEQTLRARRGALASDAVFTLARLAQAHDALLHADAEDELARRGWRGESWVRAQSARGKDAVVSAAKNALRGGVRDADEAIAVARAVADAGAHDVARELFVAIAGLAPNEPAAWLGLARELSEGVAPGSAPPPQIVMALRRARELAPGDVRARAELALRTQGAKSGPEPLDDERYLTATAAILARRKGAPAPGVAPDVADRELHWIRVVRMHKDDRVSQLIQYAREIVIAPRTESELFEPLPAEGDLTEILRARVHRKGGGVAFPTEEHNDGARPRIRWPELQPGDTVEVVVRQWSSRAIGGRGDAPFYFMDYSGSTASHPLLFNEVVVETPPGHPLYVDVLNGGKYKREEKDERGLHVVHLTWDQPVVVPEEPLAPHLSEIAPVIVGSTFHTWNDFKRWYMEAIRGFTEPDAEVRRIAAELTKGKRTRDEKLRALFEFVADDIRYVNYVSGEWWLPNRPQQLLARREGDCDDKAILLITLLRAVGIEAQEVMVQTRLTGMPSVLRAKNAAVPMFDHGIAFLPGPNGGTYLDATSPQSRLGPLPSMDARASALRFDGAPEIVTLPSSSPDDHGASVTWNIALGADGAADLTGEEQHVGDGAFWLRTYLREAEARQQYVEGNLVGPWFPTVEVDKAIDFKGDLPKGAAWVRYKAKSQGLARREQRELVVPLSPSVTYGSQLAPLVKRTLPVSLPSHLAPSHQNRTLRITAPAGYVWGPLPPGGAAEGGDFGRASIELAADRASPRVLVVKRRVVFNQHLIPVQRYDAWRQWIQSVDALMHKEVRLVPAGGAR